MKINDFVKIKKYPKGHPDERGRVVYISARGYYVSTMNQPFCGSVCRWFSEDELEA